MNHRPLNEIADEIRNDWGDRMNPVAKQYVDAMVTVRSIHEPYYLDTAVEAVARFLGVAGTWRGPTARRIKTELKGILASYENEIARGSKATH